MSKTSIPDLRTGACLLAVLAAVALSGTAGIRGQSAPRAHAPQAGASAGIPRTPWGDPDLQGTYTNSNESGIPMEQPADLAGRRLEDIDAAELSKLIRERTERQRQTAQTIGGTSENDTGAGPPHWYEIGRASCRERVSMSGVDG